MRFSPEVVRQVASLARLQLDELTLQQLTADLAQIVSFVERLDELNTDEVEPMAHAMDLHSVFAEDVLQPSLPRDAALANAPKHDDECFRVPAVL